jgi:L-Ala-D/L-Glu epimerase
MGEMKLEGEVLELRTRHAFRIARERSPSAGRSVWLRLRGDGEEGWGEAAATPYYGETADSVMALLPLLGGAVAEAAGGDAFALHAVERALEGAVGRNPAAKAGVSAALFDLAGKRAGLPVWRLLGLEPARAPLSSFTIGIDELEVMRAKVREAESYAALKIKVGTPRDGEILAMIREEAPEKLLRVDANTAWSAREAIEASAMLADFGVEFVEQPLPPGDREGYRLLRARSRLPVIVDESCTVAADVPGLAGLADGVNIKLAKCGGLLEALRIVHCARAHGMRVMIGCMIESTLGIAAALQLAPLVDYLDLDGAALLANDPFAGPGIESDGSLRFNQEAGLGVRRAAPGGA